jgi:hypothetical protein
MIVIDIINILRPRHSSSFPPLRFGVRDRVVMWDFVVDKLSPRQVSPAKFIPPIAPKNHLHHHQSIIGDMYNRPNGQTSMAAVQGPNRHLGT